MKHWVIVMLDGKTVCIQDQRNIVDGIIRGCCEAGKKSDGNLYFPHDVVKAYVKGAGEVRSMQEV